MRRVLVAVGMIIVALFSGGASAATAGAGGVAAPLAAFVCPANLGGVARTVSSTAPTNFAGSTTLWGFTCNYEPVLSVGAQWDSAPGGAGPFFGCVTTQNRIVEASIGVEYRSTTKKAKAYSNSQSGQKELGRALAQSLLADAEGRAASCPGLAVAPLAQPAPPSQPAPPTEIELSPAAIEEARLYEELPKNPEALEDMLLSGELRGEGLQGLENRWRERAESLEFLVMAWDRLLSDSDLVAIELSRLKPSFRLLFSEEERFRDPLFEPYDTSPPARMALIPASGLLARMAGPDPLTVVLEDLELLELEVELLLDRAALYRSHADAERFAVEVELDQLQKVLRILEQRDGSSLPR